jgi:hypothetical protein
VSDVNSPTNDGQAGQVGPVARTLGFAGLLPQFATLWFAWRGGDGFGQLLAFVYAAVILSFLGGMWWAFAMRRGPGQGVLVAISVVPSLVAFFLTVALAMNMISGRTALISLGVAVIASLPVDQRLFRTGEVPRGWIALRVPLSVGLGVLTILAGLAPPPQ